jgi:hypothetical protein
VSAARGNARVAGRSNPGNDVKRTLTVGEAISGGRSNGGDVIVCGVEMYEKEEVASESEVLRSGAVKVAGVS